MGHEVSQAKVQAVGSDQNDNKKQKWFKLPRYYLQQTKRFITAEHQQCSFRVHVLHILTRNQVNDEGRQTQSVNNKLTLESGLWKLQK